MKNSRREFLAGIGGLVAFATIQGNSSKPLTPPKLAPSRAPVLPAKADFTIPEQVTFINSAFTHPMPTAAAQAVRSYLDYRAEPGLALTQSVDIKAEFAALINANLPKSASSPPPAREKTSS